MTFADELLDETIASIAECGLNNPWNGRGVFSEILKEWSSMADDIWGEIEQELSAAASRGLSGATVTVRLSYEPENTHRISRELSGKTQSDIEIVVGNWTLNSVPFGYLAFRERRMGMQNLVEYLSEELSRRLDDSGLRYRKGWRELSYEISWLTAEKKESLDKAIHSSTAAAAIRAGVPIEDVIA